MSFTGKVVIVTGAGSGIGRAVARMYAEHNARVIIAERNPETGKETEQVIKKQAVRLFFTRLMSAVPMTY